MVGVTLWAIKLKAMPRAMPALATAAAREAAFARGARQKSSMVTAGPSFTPK